MRIDVIARAWGTREAGAPNGMAIAAAFLAETLQGLGHEVRRVSDPGAFDADLTITTVSPRWRRHADAATKASAADRLCYWHHAGGLPPGFGCMLAAPPVIEPEDGWSRHVVLPPSSWAAEEGGSVTGGEIVVSGAGPAKGGLIALQAARLLPGTHWLVLRGRSSQQDRDQWKQIPDAEVLSDIVSPASVLDRAALVLSPTRFDVHPLLLVEAAVRGIPVVCSDIPATHAAAGPHATYVPMNAKPEAWADAARAALDSKPPKLQLPPYCDVVRDVLEQLVAPQRVAA